MLVSRCCSRILAGVRAACFVHPAWNKLQITTATCAWSWLVPMRAVLYPPDAVLHLALQEVCTKAHADMIATPMLQLSNQAEHTSAAAGPAGTSG